MKTIISLLVFSLLLLFSCKPNPKKEATPLTKQETPATDTVASGKPIPTVWKSLVARVGEYVPDSILFANPTLTDSLKKILGPESYAEMQANWDVVSSLNRGNNILSISGCKHDACFSNMWILYINIAHDLINVYHIYDHKMTIYKGREQIILPESLRESLKNIKKNASISEQDISIK